MSAQKKALTFDLDRSPAPAAPVTPAAPPARQRAAKPQETKEVRQQVGARVTAEVYRQLKVRAAQNGDKVQDLVEQAITEFLARHPA